MEPIGFAEHDHVACISTGVAKAEARCAERGVRLTPVRKRVLEILLAQHRAMGAYEILDILRDDGFSAQPPQAYRALDFLVKQGFAHKIERVNGFLACSHPGNEHLPTFLICRECNAVAEATNVDVQEMIESVAGASGFKIEKMVLEAEGLCPACEGSATT